MITLEPLARQARVSGEILNYATLAPQARDSLWLTESIVICLMYGPCTLLTWYDVVSPVPTVSGVGDAEMMIMIVITVVSVITLIITESAHSVPAHLCNMWSLLIININCALWMIVDWDTRFYYRIVIPNISTELSDDTSSWSLCLIKSTHIFMTNNFTYNILETNFTQ